MEHSKGCKHIHGSTLEGRGVGLFCTRDIVSLLKRAVRKTHILSDKFFLKKTSAKIYFNKKEFKSINNLAPEC